MKKLLFFTFLFAASVQAKQIILTPTDTDIKIVENDVSDAEQWVKDAWIGKLKKCKDRMIKAEIELSLKLHEPIPATEDLIIQKAFSRSTYQNKKERDEKEKVK